MSARYRIVLFAIVAFSGASLASADQCITITDPSPGDTWVTGNPQTVTFTFTQGYSSCKVVFSEPGDSSRVYESVGGGPNPGASPAIINVQTPDTGSAGGEMLEVEVHVDVYGTMGERTSSEPVIIKVLKPKY